ncbi:MAG: amidophosphoribosyltransferase, partial [Oscillospiraceae bacterium]|nr:amidophosphoribosyltransferase [Oscillospiraceae bacterium]
MKKQVFTDKLHEECAVFGVSVRGGEAAGHTYNGLLALQHRGQESAGIAVSRGSDIICEKDVGLVNEVFSEKIIERLSPASMAVGHTRYSTKGGNTAVNVQPFVTEYLTGRLAAVHNGNIINAADIKRSLEARGLCFLAGSDSEIISSLIAFKTVETGDFLAGVLQAVSELEGAFSLIAMSSTGKMAAVRDKNGFRPLCLGQNAHGIAVSSESCGVESCGFTLLRDVEPGEMVVLENGGITFSAKYSDGGKAGLCVFEYVYFARPDSVVDGLSAYEARFNMGRILAAEHPVEPGDDVVVCGVPDSGIEAAAGYAAASGIPLVAGIYKNRYIGRSFIFPTQTQRENAVQLKLNPMRRNVEGKRVVLVDDSIVRGTTCARIIRMIRDAGAREVHLRISSPPFKFMCHFGTDIDSEENLIANRLDHDGICRQVSADSLGYISIEGLREACGGSSRALCDACFSGRYGVAVEPSPLRRDGGRSGT